MNKIVTYLLLHFAISAWPFLNFYGSETNHKLISISNFFLLFITYWGISLLLSEVIRKIINLSRNRIIVLYTIFVLWFFSYMAFYNFITTDLDINIRYVSVYYLMIFLIFIGSFFFISKNKTVQTFIKVFIVVVFSFSVFENVKISLKTEKTFVEKENNKNDMYFLKKKPNIYFLLLDTYSSPHIYKDKINYDNQEFLKFLKDEGFIVSENAFSNYPNTALSLSGTFSMNYLENSDIKHDDILSPDKAVMSVLKNNAYKFVLIPSSFDFIGGRNAADITIRPKNTSFLFSFSNINFLFSTYFVLLKQFMHSVSYIGPEEIQQLYDLNPSGSKFVFIHYMQLHELAYDKSCKTTMNSVRVHPSMSLFHSNLACMNITAMDSIKTILENDPNSIIIVQGDHGRPPHGWPKGTSPKDLTKQFIDRFSILSAIYIPGLDKNDPIAEYLSESPSPVNNFRIIFSLLANKPVTLLKDRCFLEPRKDKEQTHYRESVTNSSQ